MSVDVVGYSTLPQAYLNFLETAPQNFIDEQFSTLLEEFTSAVYPKSSAQNWDREGAIQFLLRKINPLRKAGMDLPFGQRVFLDHIETMQVLTGVILHQLDREGYQSMLEPTARNVCDAAQEIVDKSRHNREMQYVLRML